jgi:4-hydroxy-3-methylbut-2-enyl diphosphate reductase
LNELAAKQGIDSYLIDGVEDIRGEWLDGVQALGVTAGASAPEGLVQEVIEGLRKLGGEDSLEVPGRRETMEFALPRELRIRVVNEG